MLWPVSDTLHVLVFSWCLFTGAIVNTPPPNGVLTMVNTLATKTHKTMHYADTDESMVTSSFYGQTMDKLNFGHQIPLFSTDTNGSPRKQKYIIGRRNWCSINWDGVTGDLVFDIRVEKEKGIGQTVGYVNCILSSSLVSVVGFRYSVRTPAPRWTIG